MFVEVNNFLAVKSISVHIKGLTVIKGASSSGKSSLIRAIYESSQNRIATNRLRHGCKELSVKFGFEDDDRSIEFVKRKTGSPSITIKNGDDEQLFDKTNRAVPEEVEDILDFGMIDLGTEKYSLSIFPQFAPPLVASFSQKKVADILSSSQALDDFRVASKAISTRKTELNGLFDHYTSICDNMKDTLYSMEKELSLKEKHEGLLRGIIDKIDKLSAFQSECYELMPLVKMGKSIDNDVDALSNKHRLLSEVEVLSQTKDKKETDKSHVLEVASQLREKNRLSDEIRGVEQKVNAICVLEDASVKLAKLEASAGFMRDIKGCFCDLYFMDDNIRMNEKRLDRIVLLEELSGKKDSVDKLVWELRQMNTNILDLKYTEERIKELEQLSGDDTCPFCGTQNNKDMTTEEIKRKREEVQNNLTRLRERSAVLKEKLTEAELKLGFPINEETLNTEINRLNIEIENLNGQIDRAIQDVNCGDEVEHAGLMS